MENSCLEEENDIQRKDCERNLLLVRQNKGVLITFKVTKQANHDNFYSTSTTESREFEFLFCFIFTLSKSLRVYFFSFSLYLSYFTFFHLLTYFIKNILYELKSYLVHNNFSRKERKKNDNWEKRKENFFFEFLKSERGKINTLFQWPTKKSQTVVYLINLRQLVVTWKM